MLGNGVTKGDAPVRPIEGGEELSALTEQLRASAGAALRLACTPTRPTLVLLHVPTLRSNLGLRSLDRLVLTRSVLRLSAPHHTRVCILAYAS